MGTSGLFFSLIMIIIYDGKKDFLQPLIDKFDRRSCKDGSRELIPVFHKPH